MDATEVKRRIDAVLPLVAKQADEIERGGQLTDDLVLALRGTGINRLLLPAALGGLEAPVADASLRGARAGLRAAVEDVRVLAEQGRPVDRRSQARTALASLHACDVAVAATSTAHQIGGGAAAYTGSPLLRALCDVEAARQHLLFSPRHRIALGRALLGDETPYPPFVT